MFQYSIKMFRSNEDQGYIALVPEFKNLSAFGETAEQALREAKILVQDYIEIYKEEGISIPKPNTVSHYSKHETTTGLTSFVDTEELRSPASILVYISC